MFAVYLSTLIHLVTPATVTRLADLAGWDWGPKYFAPVTFLVTRPICWLPDHLKLPALNLFAAACAAATLALLARSVALLPHDRTNEQRLREQGESSLLTIPTAWLPPVFAVLICGLQLSFWERAVEFRDESILDSGEMFNLLIFAYLVRCLLEFRLSRKESWLTRFALVYGLGVANNWAMIAYFPGFLVAVVWLKGLDFFDWRFALRMTVWGLAGTCLLLLLPLLNTVHHFSQVTFGQSLHVILSDYKLALLHLPPNRKVLLMFAATSVLPVFLMSIRWASSFGDNSPFGVALANFGFNLGHIFFLGCCLWVALDPPFSPRQVFGFLPFLPLYYLGALSVGYFSGYLLLVFGVRPGVTRQRPTQSGGPWLAYGVNTLILLLAIALPLVLVARNLPQLQTNRSVAGAFDTYFARVQEALPPAGAVVLADGDDLPMLYFLRARLARGEAKPDDIFIDTSSLSQSWDYVRLLDSQHPGAGISSTFTNLDSDQPSEIDCIHLLEDLSAKHDVYYLHPSFGYYFERFYPECHGLVYRLRFYPDNAWIMPPLPANLVAENRTFWKDSREDLTFVAHAAHDAVATPTNALFLHLDKYAHLTSETNQFAPILGKYYSRALNYWAVEVDKSAPPTEAATWREAGDDFDLARQLDRENSPARINLEFNQDMLAGKPPVFKKLAEFEDQLGNYRQWFELINNGGPFDEPNFCMAFGGMLRQGNNYRQAVQQFERQRALMPLDPSGSLQLATTYLYVLNHPDALYYAYPPLAQTGAAAAAAAEQASRVDPYNTNALYLEALADVQLGVYLQGHSQTPDPSGATYSQAYSNSLAAAGRLLSISPKDPNALFLQSMSLMQLSNFDEAITPLSDLIAQTNNPVALLNRAICYLWLDKLDLSQADYEQVVKTHPEAYQAEYGLADIAYKKKDFATAVKYYEIYQSNAPAVLKQSTEFKNVTARIKELKADPH
jgi:tetratricopeptide (TPR) repeat protein